jgi:2',3'-cyclic-nucleotide 2'-phosphodiesterase / 3'-nucleotidase
VIFSTIKSIYIKLFYLLLITFTVNAQTVKIKIIETSDVHGAILPYDLVNDTTTTSSLAQVYSYLNMERNLSRQHVILLDNGDILQGDPLVYYYNYEDTTTTNIYAQAMNFMSYDVATIGNHDIETGHKVYDKFRTEINFPWLAANAVNTETGEPYFEPYTIIEKEGVKVAILGLITPGIPHWLPKKIWEGIEFEDMIETAKKWVPIILEKENPDLLIGLFHSGVDYTYGGETKETYRNENASQLVAEQVSGFDVVFVGHDHAGWNFKTANVNGDSVLIVGPLSRAKTLAVATITMDFDSVKQEWAKKTVEGEVLDVSKFRSDSNFMNKFMTNLNIVRNYVAKPLGEITRSVSAKQSLFGPSEFVDLIHTFQFNATDADISFVSPLSFSAQIDSGWIYVRDMFKLYRYENFLYTMELTGKEIKDHLEFSFAGWFNQMENEDDHLLKFKKNEEGKLIYSERSGFPMLVQRYYNFSSAAGIIYTVDVTKPDGERVNITSMSDGSPFELSENYTVAINSYRGNGGGGHLTKGAGIPEEELSQRIINSTDKDLRFYMMKWIERKKTISPKIIGNWKVVPENYWQSGKKKDYKILFNE